VRYQEEKRPVKAGMIVVNNDLDDAYRTFVIMTSFTRSFWVMVPLPGRSHALRFTKGPAPSCAPPRLGGTPSPIPPCSLPVIEIT